MLVLTDSTPAPLANATKADDYRLRPRGTKRKVKAFYLGHIIIFIQTRERAMLGGSHETHHIAATARLPSGRAPHEFLARRRGAAPHSARGLDTDQGTRRQRRAAAVRAHR